MKKTSDPSPTPQPGEMSSPDAPGNEPGVVESISASAPKLYRGAYAKALEGKASPRQAIKAKCYECCGFEEVKERISECSVRRCPLWAYRPYRLSDEQKPDTDPTDVGPYQPKDPK